MRLAGNRHKSSNLFASANKKNNPTLKLGLFFCVQFVIFKKRIWSKEQYFKGKLKSRL